MSQADLNHSSSTDPEVIQYRAPSVLAIVGLALGIASALALLHPLLLCVFPVPGLLISALALRRIREAGSSIGRKAALAGLGLSVLFATAAPIEWASTRWVLEREAEQAVQAWFDHFRHGQPELAHQMGMNYLGRAAPDKVWDYYRKHPEAQRDLRTYVEDPLARTLLALHMNARARLFETIGIDRREGGDVVNQVYAVTYYDVAAKRKRTFFVRLGAERIVHPPTGEVYWRILNVSGGIRPLAL